ncbi:MAG: TIM barrel protein [Candidatus Latescibacterota bacterium]
MKLRLACADFTFPLLPHAQSLDLIAALGFGGVDIGLFEARSHLWPSRELTQGRRAARRLRRQLDDRGLRAADVFLQLDPDFRPCAINRPEEEPRRRAREWYLRTLEYAAECGCHHVTLLPGVPVEGEPWTASFRRAADELAWRVEQARPGGTTLGVEAHVGSLVPRPSLALKLVESVPGLTLTLDYTHFTRRGMPDSAVAPLVPHASHFHVRGARRGRLQERFSRSTIDYRQVFALMQASRYRGWIGIEYVWIDWEHCSECDNLSETILFRDLFRSLARGGAAAS